MGDDEDDEDEVGDRVRGSMTAKKTRAANPNHEDDEDEVGDEEGEIVRNDLHTVSLQQYPRPSLFVMDVAVIILVVTLENCEP